MSIWDEYPAGYRQPEVQVILAAVRAGECVSVVGLSGAGKSNLMGFLYYRCNSSSPRFYLIDGNRSTERTAAGLMALIGQALGAQSAGFTALEAAAAERLAETPGSICLLIDRFDALPEPERAAACGPLRALRDGYKYRLSLVLATRQPIEANSELAELFYANTLWVGPLCLEDARWSAAQYAARRGQTWDDAVLDRLVALSWGYPSLLRACCEAYAAGTPLDEEVMRVSPPVQRRVQEFWLDAPSSDAIRQSKLQGQPLLRAAAAQVSAAGPELTASEHRLLAYMQNRAGQICEKDDLIHAVWPEDRVIDGLRDDSLAQLIRRLRQKVELDPSNPQRIQTISGRGYRYIP